jgi:hypothetical protein
MRYLLVVLAFVLCFGVSGCGKSTKKQIKEDEMKSKSDARIKLINEYNDCVARAKGDANKVKECQSLMKAADKIK